MRRNKSITDGELVVKYQSGDHKVLTLLVERWHQVFCKKAYWIVKNADMSKDIAQDTWKTIINSLDSLKNPNSFGSWALRIVYTKSLDCLKLKAHNTVRLNERIFGKPSEKDEPKYDDNLKVELLKAVRSLPHKQQAVITLFYVEDYSLKQIGDILNISIGTAKSRLFHAREKLKLILKNKNYEK